jgi:hypothetical protein
MQSSTGNGGVALLTTVLALVAISGCGSQQAGDAGKAPVVIERSTSVPDRKESPQTVKPSHCSPGLPSCRTAEGRITFVERVDPDGDGDAHFVIVDPQGISLPGLTAIDVRKGLRPDPLPKIGDLISAAGPVQTGSYGQSQIHALELHVAGE